MKGSEEGPEDVEVYTSPWVSGTRAAAYFGPVSTAIFLADEDTEDRVKDWLRLELELMDSIKQKAHNLGANAIVGIEVTLDPFAEQEGKVGLRLHAVGTAARLESLF